MENIASSRSHYGKILQAHGANMRKYWLVEVIENDCIVTRVGVYNEISPEPSSRHNTVTVYSKPCIAASCSLISIYSIGGGGGGVASIGSTV